VVAVRYPQTVQPLARRRSPVRLRRLLILVLILILRVVRRAGVGLGFGFGRGGGAMRLRPRGGAQVHVRAVRLLVQSLYRTLLGARLPSLRLFLRGILPATCLRGGSSFCGEKEGVEDGRGELTFWKPEDSLVHSASAACDIPPDGESSQGDSSLSCISMMAKTQYLLLGVTRLSSQRETAGVSGCPARVAGLIGPS
jgi:hypothetical protein